MMITLASRWRTQLEAVAEKRGLIVEQGCIALLRAFRLAANVGALLIFCSVQAWAKYVLSFIALVQHTFRSSHLRFDWFPTMLLWNPVLIPRIIACLLC